MTDASARAEIDHLKAENLALETLLVCFMGILAQTGTIQSATVRLAFQQAQQRVEEVSEAMGGGIADIQLSRTRDLLNRIEKTVALP